MPLINIQCQLERRSVVVVSIVDSKVPPEMEFLNTVIKSNDFGLRKIFPWDHSIPSQSDFIKSCVSDCEKKYLAKVIQFVFKKKAELKIERIQNPYLWGRYVLQYDEMKADPQSQDVEEHIMIHATSRSNAYKIAETNFDWRLLERARFGKGVSFAKYAQYARQHASRKEVYIVAGVLVANSNKGRKHQKIPKQWDDTTNGRIEQNVCVKYRDNDFYPYYVVQAL